MNTEDTTVFIAGYSPESQSRICFAWNGKHAADFVDVNDTFRQQVIASVLAEPGKASLDLVGDLFQAEGQRSKEAWCIRDSFSKLGTILLKCGGASQLDRFLDSFALSFDSYSECHAMTLDQVTLAPLISEVEARLAGAKDKCQKARLVMARDLFAKHESGNPLKGMFKVNPSQLGPARAVSKVKIWFHKVLRLFRRG
ncbi:MAG: hypothetical protein ABSE63_01935 [Thermoguttaceae bacterium]|jgi:hypothetical protein